MHELFEHIQEQYDYFLNTRTFRRFTLLFQSRTAPPKTSLAIISTSSSTVLTCTVPSTRVSEWSLTLRNYSLPSTVGMSAVYVCIDGYVPFALTETSFTAICESLGSDVQWYWAFPYVPPLCVPTGKSKSSTRQKPLQLVYLKV